MKIFALTAALLLGLSIAACAAPPKNMKTKTAKVKNGAAQVDGIVDAAVDKLWAQTDVYWHEGDYPRIIALDRIITQADPHFVESFATGGYLMESMQRNRDAEAFYQEAIRKNPTSSYAYFSLGMFYFNALKDYPAAARIFEKDTQQKDAAIQDWKMLAHSYEKTHALDKAVAAWKTIKARWPNGAAVDVNLNRVLAAQKAAASASNGQ